MWACWRLGRLGDGDDGRGHHGADKPWPMGQAQGCGQTPLAAFDERCVPWALGCPQEPEGFWTPVLQIAACSFPGAAGSCEPTTLEFSCPALDDTPTGSTACSETAWSRHHRADRRRRRAAAVVDPRGLDRRRGGVRGAACPDGGASCPAADPLCSFRLGGNRNGPNDFFSHESHVCTRRCESDADAGSSGFWWKASNEHHLSYEGVDRDRRDAQPVHAAVRRHQVDALRLAVDEQHVLVGMDRGAALRVVVVIDGEGELLAGGEST